MTDVQTTLNGPLPGDEPEAPAPAENEPAGNGVDAPSEDNGQHVSAEETEVDTEDPIVTIGDEKPEETDSGTIKHMRKLIKEKDRRARELEQKVQQMEAERQTPVEPLGPRPKAEDFPYDDEAYDKAIDAWYAQKHEGERQQFERQAQVEKANREFELQVSAYKAAGRKLTPDFEERVAVAEHILSELQRNIIIDAADKPELVMVALAANPTKAKALASEANPLRFTKKVVQLEAQLKVAKRAPETEPELPVRGSAPNHNSAKLNLDRTLEQCRRTGNYTKLVQTIRQQNGRS